MILNGELGKLVLDMAMGDDETIILPSISLFARKEFVIENLDNIIGAVLHIDFDDSFVAYINGVEIARENIGGSVGIPPAFDELAISDEFEAKIYQGGFPNRYDIDNIKSLLNTGKNILAVQVHNLDEGSSDLSFIPFFTLQEKSSSTVIQPPKILQLNTSSIHTNFKIKSAGEPLILSDQSGSIIDSVYSEYLISDISYGRQPDGGDNWFYFSEPTPNSPNVTQGSDSLIIPDTLFFSHQGGFYNENISLVLSNTNINSSIYYTVNGSEPNQNSIKYDSPIVVNQTTVIRAVSFTNSGSRSEIITNTYFVNENRPLPIFSISTSPDNFDRLYENFDTEIPIHIEMYERNGNLAFSHNAGAEVFGSGSAGFEQKSLAIFFRGKYGVGELRYKVFPDRPFEEYESFLLRNGGNDWWSTLIRDPMISNGLMKGTNIDYQAYRPSLVYINGEYWGIHNIREKVNEHYIMDHHYIPEDSLDMLEYKERITPEIIHGDLVNYNSMIDYLSNNDITDSSNYNFVESIIDIDNFIDYQIIEIYSANIDWPSNNNKFWRSKSKNGKWRWILYDTDTGFGLWTADYDPPGWQLNHFEYATNDSYSAEEGWPNPSWSTFIFRKLLENDTFKNAFINRFADYLNTRLSSQNVLNVISDFRRGISNAIGRHLERWFRDTEDYNFQLNKIIDFATYRSESVREQMLNFFALNEIVEISIKIEPQNAGVVKLNSIILSNSTFNGKYFQGNPIQLTASPNSGYRFAGWDGSLSSSNSISLDPYEGLILKANFEPDTSGTIVINEINYNSNNTHDPGDWVELFNNSGKIVDLSDWYFSDAVDSHKFVIPAGIEINSGDYIVLSRNVQKFTEIFPDMDKVIGDFNFGLNSSGDTVRIYNKQHKLIDSAAYLSEYPWPVTADGNGPTLELTNPGSDNNNFINWLASEYLGSPGEQNSKFDIFIEKNRNVEKATSDYKFMQNYPNPFTSSTNIAYKIEFPSHVEIRIYNILGQEIKTLISKEAIPNEYTILWNGENNEGKSISSGVYIYVMFINYEIVEVKKVIKL